MLNEAIHGLVMPKLGNEIVVVLKHKLLDIFKL